VLACVRKLRDSPRYHLQKLIFPRLIQFIYLLVPGDTVRGQVGDEILGSLSVFLCYHSRCFGCCMPVVFAFLVGVWLVLSWFLQEMRLAMGHTYWRENVRGGEDLVKVLELLSGFKPIGVVD